MPEILWYKDANPVEPSSTVGIFNDGTELRISTIRNEDIGDYTCIARNGEGQVSHTARVIIAGGAVIMVITTTSFSAPSHAHVYLFVVSSIRTISMSIPIEVPTFSALAL